MWNLKNLSKLKDMAVDMVSPSYEEEDDDSGDPEETSPSQSSGYGPQRNTGPASAPMESYHDPVQTSPLPNSYVTPQRRAVPPQSRQDGWEETQTSPSPRAAGTEHNAAASSQLPNTRESSEAASSPSTSTSRSPYAPTATTRHPSLTNNESIDTSGGTSGVSESRVAPPVSSPGQTPQPMHLPDGKPSPGAPSRKREEEGEEEQRQTHAQESVAPSTHSQHSATKEVTRKDELAPNGSASQTDATNREETSNSVVQLATQPSGSHSASQSQVSEERLKRHVEKLEEKVKKHESYQKDMETRIQQYSEEVKVAHDKTVAYYEYHMNTLRKQLEAKDADIQELGQKLANEQEARANLEASESHNNTKRDEQLREREQQIASLRMMVRDLETNLNQQREHNETVGKELQVEKTKLVGRVQHLEAQNAELSHANGELKERIADSEEQRRETLQRIHELEKQLAQIDRGALTPRQQMVPVAHVQEEENVVSQRTTAGDGPSCDGDVRQSPGFQLELERSVEKVREAYEKRITDLQTASAQIQAENDALQRKMEEEERDAEARFNAALQGKVQKEQEVGASAAEVEAAQHAEQHLRDEIDHLRQELDEARSAHERGRDIEKQLEGVSAALASTQKELETQRVAFSTLSSEKEAHDAELQQTIAALREQVRSHERDDSMDRAEHEKEEELRRMANELAAVRDELERARSAVKLARADAEQRETEVSAAHRRVEELEHEVEGFQEHVRALEGRDEEWSDKLKAATSEAADLRHQLEEMSDKHLMDMESLKQELAAQKHAAADEQASQLTQALQKSHEETHTLHEQVQTLTKEASEDKASLHHARERADALQRDIAALQSECETVRSREENLKGLLSQKASKDQDSLAVVLAVKKELEEKNAHHNTVMSQLHRALMEDLVRGGVDLSAYMQSKPSESGAGRRGSNRHTVEQSDDDDDSDDQSTEDSDHEESERNRVFSRATESLSLSDLISIQTSEVHRLRQVAEKADSIQTQWERTYEQARDVNTTLNNQIKESWKTIGALREEVSVKSASLQNLQMDLAKERQRYSALQEQFSDVNVTYQRVKEELERTRKDIDEKTNGDQSWAEKVQTLQSEVEELRANLQAKEEELDSANVAVDNLQRVLDAFKESKDRDVEERTLFLQKEADELRAELKRREEGRQTEEGQADQLSQQHLKQLAAKNVEISTLQKKLSELKRIIEETSNQIHGDTMIDKRVISYLVVNYIHAFVAGKQLEANDIIKVLSGLLKWDETMQEKAGLIPGPTNPRPNQGRGLMGGLVHSVFAGRGNASNSSAAADKAGKDGGKRSIAEMWVDFLLQESEAAAAASNSQTASGDTKSPLTSASASNEKRDSTASSTGAKQETSTASANPPAS